MIKEVNGDILDAKEFIICQQVNCLGAMGAGLAGQIKRKYPEVYPSYIRFCKGAKDYNLHNLLGQVQTVPVANDTKVIANLFGQYFFGRGRRYTCYGALREALMDVLILAKLFNDSVAIPYGLGCGLAGGDWNIVYGIIQEVFKDYDITIYKKEV